MLNTSFIMLFLCYNDINQQKIVKLKDGCQNGCFFIIYRHFNQKSQAFLDIFR